MEGGMPVMQPKDKSLQAKVHLCAFFHKIVMTRDRLRWVMESGYTKLTDADKIELQQYITRIYDFTNV